MAQTTSFGSISCVKCVQLITVLESPDHVIFWPSNNDQLAWHFHTECYEDFLIASMEFYKVFVIEKKKKRPVN